MSIWGEQWECPNCKWQNVFVRRTCRHCRATRPDLRPAEAPKADVIDLNKRRAARETHDDEEITRG